VLYFDYMLVNRLVSTFTICKSIHIFSRSSYIDFQVGEGLQHTHTHIYIHIHIYIFIYLFIYLFFHPLVTRCQAAMANDLFYLRFLLIYP